MPDPMIEVKNLTKYYNNFLALDKISFHVKGGEIFSFLGPNGAGKTTTFKILTGLIKATSGQVYVMGFDINKEPHEFKFKIGVLFEQPYLYERLTSFQNLYFFSKIYKVEKYKIDKLLEEVDLFDKRNSLAGNLSKGQKQRLSIARTLLHDPEILFLDEPTSGLDPASAIEVRKIINKLCASGKTIFLTTHYMEEADQLSHHLAIINSGNIITTDTPENLKEKHGEKKLEIKYISNGRVDLKTFTLSNKADFKEISEILGENEIKDIRIKEPTLEEVFIKLTGKT